MVFRIYVDSSILVDAVIGFRSTKAEARRILDRINKKYNQVFIPQMVLGESCLMVMRKSEASLRTKNIIEFTNLIQTLVADLDRWTPPLTKEVLEHALRIRSTDFGLDYCDAVLVSHALLDLNAQCLFTTDNKIHHSHSVDERVQLRCSNGERFEIIDSID